MTFTAEIIRGLEDLSNPSAQAGVIAEAANDTIFRLFLRRCYDPHMPYMRTTPPLPLHAVVHPQVADAILADQWPLFEETLNRLVDALEVPQATWTELNNEAWPVYERCLSKRITGVDVATVRSVWGDIPEFKVGQANGGKIDDWPGFYVEPLHAGERRVLVVRRPFSDGCVPVDVFTDTGALSSVGKRTLDALRSFRYEGWLAEQSHYAKGIVFDAMLKPDGTLMLTDVLPLKVFHEQAGSPLYRDRLHLLDNLRQIVNGHEPFKITRSVLCKNDMEIDTVVADLHRDHPATLTTGVVAKHPNGGYPFKANGTWVRLAKW
jgi:hypothetical protein